MLGAIDSDLAILRSASATDAAEGDSPSSISATGIGDLHQPLHISFADDRGGNSIKAAGPCSGSFDASLHSVWDTCVIERRIFGPGTDRVARARAAAAILSTPRSRRPSGATGCARSPGNGPANPTRSRRAARTGYCVRKDGACWYSADRQDFANGDPQRTLAVDDAYLDRARPIVETRLRRAGIRLADALNRSFDPDFSGWKS